MNDARWVAILIGGSALVTLAVAIQPWLALALIPIGVMAALLVPRPGLALPLLWAALLLSDGFELPFSFVIPLTIGKLSTVGFLVLWLVHCLAARKSPVSFNLLSVALLGTLVMLVVGLSQLREYTSFTTRLLVGFSSLVVLAHVIWTVLEPRDVWWGLRLSVVVFILVLPLSLFFGGTIEEFGGYRSTGFGGNPNEWSMTLLVGTGLMLGVIASERSWLLRWTAPGLLAFVGICIVSTVSRAGVLVFVLLLPLALLILWKQRVALVGAGIAAVASLPFVVPWETVMWRFSSFTDESELEMDGSVRDRALTQRFAWEAFVDRPVFGLGTGAFEGEVRYLSSGQVSLSTHNTYLQVLSESGVIGVVFYGIPFALVGWMMYRVWRHSPSRRMRSIGLGLCYSYLGYAVMNATMNGIEHATAYFVLGVGVAAYRAHTLPVETLLQIGLADEDEVAAAKIAVPEVPARRLQLVS